jgi:putative membrane protein
MYTALLHTATEPYQFHWTWHPDVILLCLALAGGYLYAVTRLRPLVSDAGRVRRRQVAFYMAGVAAIFLVAGTPVHDISESYLLSVHMFQHTVFTMVAAPLLLAGVPAWMWQALLREPGVLPVARRLTHPLVAFSLVNAVLVFSHLPVTVDFALQHHWFHLLVHVTLVATALLMWWPVLSAVPELPRLSAPLQMVYLFLQSLLPTVIASFVTFADGAVYSFYRDAPRTWGLTAVEDQQVGGGIMKVMGSIILWSFIALAFFGWYAREQAESKEPHWDEVEEELDRLGLTAPGGTPH